MDEDLRYKDLSWNCIHMDLPWNIRTKIFKQSKSSNSTSSKVTLWSYPAQYMFDIVWKSYYEIISATYPISCRWNEVKWRHKHAYAKQQWYICAELSLHWFHFFCHTFIASELHIYFLDPNIGLHHGFFLLYHFHVQFSVVVFFALSFSVLHFSIFTFLLLYFFLFYKFDSCLAVPNYFNALNSFSGLKKLKNQNEKAEKGPLEAVCFYVCLEFNF